MAPKFFVLARVVSRDGALEFWRERLVHLCEVSKTEPYGDSYYWGYDLDGAKDTLWGLEGYTHPIGFFIDHVSSDIFKREMELVDRDRLLRTVQGLGSPDYDLHHYDQYGGYLKREDDLDADSKTSVVVAIHYWAVEESRRVEVLDRLASFSTKARQAPIGLQSALVLKECRDTTLSTLWLRFDSLQTWEDLQNSGEYKSLAADVEPSTKSTQVHRSQVFNGHLGLKDKVVVTEA
ncbi:hypothetical protein FALCPG4_011584 [Fusarium falciforme]